MGRCWTRLARQRWKIHWLKNWNWILIHIYKKVLFEVEKRYKIHTIQHTATFFLSFLGSKSNYWSIMNEFCSLCVEKNEVCWKSPNAFGSIKLCVTFENMCNLYLVNLTFFFALFFIFFFIFFPLLFLNRQWKKKINMARIIFCDCD